MYFRFEKPLLYTNYFQNMYNYGFAGSSGAGKSSLINAIRGISAKHPLAAGRFYSHHGTCERYDYDEGDDGGVTLWEFHYPRKVCAYFEFIE